MCSHHGYTALRVRSRQMRFLTRKKELTPAELRYFNEVNPGTGHRAADSADGRQPGTVEYQITLAPGREHDHPNRSGSATTSGQPMAKKAR
jgi:hypothetical protein